MEVPRVLACGCVLSSVLDEVLISPLDLDELPGVALIVVRMDCEHATTFSMLTLSSDLRTMRQAATDGGRTVAYSGACFRTVAADHDRVERRGTARKQERAQEMPRGQMLCEQTIVSSIQKVTGAHVGGSGREKPAGQSAHI